MQRKSHGHATAAGAGAGDAGSACNSSSWPRDDNHSAQQNARSASLDGGSGAFGGNGGGNGSGGGYGHHSVHNRGARGTNVARIATNASTQSMLTDTDFAPQPSTVQGQQVHASGGSFTGQPPWVQFGGGNGGSGGRMTALTASNMSGTGAQIFCFMIVIKKAFVFRPVIPWRAAVQATARSRSKRHVQYAIDAAAMRSVPSSHDVPHHCHILQ